MGPVIGIEVSILSSMKRPFCTKPRVKTAAPPSPGGGSFRPEERTSATTGGGEPGVNQPQIKQDSVADEMPGENPDMIESEFSGPGDYSSQNLKQPLLDLTPCNWMAQQVLSGEFDGEGLPQDAVAESRDGTMLVSVSLCHMCDFEKTCYGLSDAQDENRIRNKVAAVSPEMPEILVAERLLRRKLASDQDAARLLVSSGFSPQAAGGVLRLMEGLRRR